MVKTGRLFTEDEILSIAKELLGILTYLGNLRPPVVHRDVKVSAYTH
jgi:serine/threonine protein kinase